MLLRRISTINSSLNKPCRYSIVGPVFKWLSLNDVFIDFIWALRLDTSSAMLSWLAISFSIFSSQALSPSMVSQSNRDFSWTAWMRLLTLDDKRRRYPLHRVFDLRLHCYPNTFSFRKKDQAFFAAFFFQNFGK